MEDKHRSYVFKESGYCEQGDEKAGTQQHQVANTKAIMASTADSGVLEGVIHFTGGAIGGTAGTAITCPLEVVKTRLQSSHGHEAFQRPSSSKTTFFADMYRRVTNPRSTIIYRSFQSVWREGGMRALYKGIGPNLIGVAPSKAIYFGCYSSMKRFLNNSPENQSLPFEMVPNSAFVHMASAGVAGFVTATCINPVWVVKTRLQLHHGRLTAKECFLRIWQREGPRGFFRGVTGSYIGIGETIVQFVLYEYFRSLINDPEVKAFGRQDGQNFVHFMVAGGMAKLFAGVALYWHEVIRTRLREEGASRGLVGTVVHIYRHEGIRAFYRGLTVQLMRSVPNTMVTMGAYEIVVYLLHRSMLEECRESGNRI